MLQAVNPVGHSGVSHRFRGAHQAALVCHSSETMIDPKMMTCDRLSRVSTRARTSGTRATDPFLSSLGTLTASATMDRRSRGPLMSQLQAWSANPPIDMVSAMTDINSGVVMRP
jgi:hypothetical protein